MKIHKLLYYIALFLLPVQTRILYNPDSAYVSWYFDYHLAFFFYLTDILLIACFTSWLIFDRPELNKPVKKLLIIASLFLVACLLSLLHVKHVSLGVYETLKWLEFYLLILYIYFNLRTKGDVVWSLGILFISATFQALVGIWQFHVQHTLGLNIFGEYFSPLGTSGLATINTISGKIIRAYGTMPHPNILGAFLLLGLVCGLYFVSHETEVRGLKTKIISITALTLILIGIFTTFSRLVWLAASVAIICSVVYFFWKQKKNLIMIVIPVIIASATILVFFHTDLKARISDSGNTSVTDRYFFDKQGIALAKEHPIFGVGVGNYIYALQEKYSLQPWQNQPAHNIFIFITAELGLVGIGLFVAFLYVLATSLRNITWNTLSLSVAMIGILFLLLSLFDHYFVTIQQGRLMFATVLGLIAALPNLTHEKTN